MGNDVICRRVQPSETQEMKAWVAEHHYLASCPPGFAFILEFVSPGRPEIVGAMMFGRPAARALNPDRVLELTRMYFVDAAPKNTESRALSLARAYIRRWYPSIRLLLAYADPEQGHRGTVYEADNWAPFGQTKRNHGHGWKSREGRRAAQCSVKQRWVRTP